MNTLKTWLDAERGRTAQLAKHLGCWPPFVFKMATGQKPVPIHHALAIEQFTGGEVTRKDMLPDIWHKVWPDLAGQPVNQPTPAGQGDSNVQI